MVMSMKVPVSVPLLKLCFLSMLHHFCFPFLSMTNDSLGMHCDLRRRGFVDEGSVADVYTSVTADTGPCHKDVCNCDSGHVSTIVGKTIPGPWIPVDP